MKPGEIKINTGMNGFVQTGDSVESFRDFNKNKKDQNEPKMKMIRFPVKVLNPEKPVFCPECGAFLKKDGIAHSDVFHLPYGHARTVLDVERQRYECTNPNCRVSFSEEIPFKDPHTEIPRPSLRYQAIFYPFSLISSSPGFKPFIRITFQG